MKLQLTLARDDGTTIVEAGTTLNADICPTDEFVVDLICPIFDERARHLALSRLAVKFSWLDFTAGKL